MAVNDVKGSEQRKTCGSSVGIRFKSKIKMKIELAFTWKLVAGCQQNRPVCSQSFG